MGTSLALALVCSATQPDFADDRMRMAPSANGFEWLPTANGFVWRFLMGEREYAKNPHKPMLE